MRLHVLFHVGLLCEGPAADDALERLLSGVTAQRPELSHDWTTRVSPPPAAADSPPDVLLQVKVFGKGLDAVVALQFGPFTFQLLCWTEATDFSLLSVLPPMPHKASSGVPPSPQVTCGSVEALLAASGAFGNNDLLQVGQLRQIAADAADLGFGSLFARTVDGRGSEGLTLHTLTGHLKGRQT